MFGRRRSYAEAVQGRRRAARRLGVLLLVFIGYELLSGLFLATYVMKSQAMCPTILPGERIIVTPLAFGPRTLFGKLPGISRPDRGEIVVVEPNYTKRPGFWELLSDSIVRFVTFQLVSTDRSGSAGNGPTRFAHDGILSAPTLQRVIGLPGDTIQMDNFEFKIKSAGSDQFLTEFEFSSTRYDISHDDAPKSWRADLPGSGHMDARVLEKDEYFIAGDARSSSSDSRLWGPVHIDRFRAKALLRYWPPKRFGSP
ncbi:MAG: signal peptidase I [Rectinemataceae bacterium]